MTAAGKVEHTSTVTVKDVRICIKKGGARELRIDEKDLLNFCLRVEYPFVAVFIFVVETGIIFAQ